MLLEELSNASGPSGYEGDVRKIIKEKIIGYVDEIKVDNMGNIIAHKKGVGKKVIVDAHMDEVGFIITGYNEDGTLKFYSLGGIAQNVIPSKVVLVGERKIPGVIGVKPIHLQSSDERIKSVAYNECCIDIGAKDKEETKRLVNLGDFAVFDTEFSEFGEGLYKGKAFDDRMGCAVLIEALKENYKCDLYGVFNVQEEVGERGAFVSAFNLNADIGIVLEGTICADMPSVPKHLSATEVGKGPAISIMDKTSIFDEDIANEIMEISNKNNIPYQRRRAIAGGNDAYAIHASGEGAKIATISVPCRYIHSSVSVASKSDFENTIRLLVEYIKTI
jgi:putative aminopeptidase FrvX